MDITANIDKTQENPFFLPYNTPHDTVPFDRIKTEHYEEAFMEGIRRDDEAIDKLINDPEEPTFENTLTRVDLSKGEHYYDLLDRDMPCSPSAGSERTAARACWLLRSAGAACPCPRH